MDAALALILQYKYLVLLPLAVVEGPIVALVAGYLVHIGFLELWTAYGILLLGDLGPDALFYAIGYYGGSVRVVRERIEHSTIFNGHFGVAKRLWTDHGGKMMLLGKLSYGLGLPFLASAGLVRMPFKRFMAYAFPVTVLQYTVIMAIGYVIGQSYQAAGGYVELAYMVMGALVLLAVVAYILITRYSRRELEKLEKEEEREIGITNDTN